MDILVYNAQWMLWNMLLACVPLICVGFLMRLHTTWIKIPLVVTWFLFLPNSLYIVTDLYHLTYEWFLVKGIFKLLLLLQFGLFIPTAIAAYVLSLDWFVKERDHLLRQTSKKKTWINFLKSNYSIYFLHLFVAFGVILGRVERTNSWDVVAHPQQVVIDVFNLMSSPIKVFWIVLLWLAICILFPNLPRRLNRSV